MSGPLVHNHPPGCPACEKQPGDLSEEQIKTLLESEKFQEWAAEWFTETFGAELREAVRLLAKAGGTLRGTAEAMRVLGQPCPPMIGDVADEIRAFLEAGARRGDE